MDFILDMFDGEKKDKDSKKEGKKSKDGVKPKDIAKLRDAFCKSKQSTYMLFCCCSFVCYSGVFVVVTIQFSPFATVVVVVLLIHYTGRIKTRFGLPVPDLQFSLPILFLNFQKHLYF